MYLHKTVIWVLLIVFITSLTRINLSAASPTPASEDCSNAAESTRPCTRIELMNILINGFFNVNRYILRSMEALFLRVLSDDAIMQAPQTAELDEHKAQIRRFTDAAALWLQKADDQADTPTNTAGERLAKLATVWSSLNLISQSELLEKTYNTTGVEQPSSQPDIVLIEQLLQKYELPQWHEELRLLKESFSQNFYKLVERYLDSLSPLAQADEHEMFEWYESNKNNNIGDFGEFLNFYEVEDIF